MHLTIFYLSLLLFTLIQAHPLNNITIEPEIHGKRPTNGHLQLNPQPNPYPVPGKPFSIHFGIQGDEIPPGDTRNCVLGAYRALKNHVRQHRDGPIPQHPAALHFRYGTVGFGIGPATAPPQPVLSYSDAIEILRAFSVRSSQEGYHETFGRIEYTRSGGLLGDASLFRI